MAESTISETAVVPDTSPKEVKEKVVEREGGVEAATARSAQNESSSSLDPQREKSASSVLTTATTTTEQQQKAANSRPSLVPLGSGHTQSSSPVQQQTKRFSAVNINKKFLEKNTASGSSNSISSVTTGTKSGNVAARPSQPTPSHSKLVTTKLTATPGISSAPAGWSRPSSVTTSPAPGNKSPGSSSPLPTPAPSSQTPNSAVPQIPHLGKVIQPQPRSVIAQFTSNKENNSSKPAWGNVKSAGVSLPARNDIQPNDFPTAAEVANVSASRKQSKTEDQKANTPPKPPSNQLRSEDVDTFRGVHLDPNAHHWGEEQEDDDNFLDGVIEFGDGRQYKIENSDSLDALVDGKDNPTVPLNKDDRFADDFDRSWPKSQDQPPPSKDFSAGSTYSTSPKSHAAHSPQDSSRVLFNERSNRLEPYTQSSYRPRQGSLSSKGASTHEANGDIKGHGPRGVQVLQKPAVYDQGRSRRFSNSGNTPLPPTPNGAHTGPREHRREHPPPSPRMLRDPPPYSGDANSTGDHKGRRTSMGPPPVPHHAGQRERQPPHLSPNVIQRRLSSREHHSPSPEPPLSAGLVSSGRLPPHSPAMSHASFSTLSPLASSHLQLAGTGLDIDEVRKDIMHTAAERAKARRQQEEAEREARMERARLKAAEFAAKMQGAEAEKATQRAAEEASRTVQELAAIAMIEEAVKGVNLMQEEPNSSTPSPVQHLKSPPGRRASITSQPSQSSSFLATASPVESWRDRPLAPTFDAKHREARQEVPPPTAAFATSELSAVERIASIADSSNDDLEIVDFTDMDKFVGITEPLETVEETVQDGRASRPIRPSASDFFEEPVTDISTLSTKKADYGAWRKRVEVNNLSTTSPETTKISQLPSVPPSEISVHQKGDTSMPETPVKEFQRHDNHTVPSPSYSSQKTPLRTQFREAPMSALDDTMSRIKGVLNGMQIQDGLPKVVLPKGADQVDSTYGVKLPKERWVPPALRARHPQDFDHPRESFLVTVEYFPLSTVQTAPAVQLPLISKRSNSIPKPRLNAFHRLPHDRGLSILSFDPPVPGLSWKSPLINDILFRGSPATVKGKFKYTVVLPNRGNWKNRTLPSPKVSGAFGRPTGADGASSWRKPVIATKANITVPIMESSLESGLDTWSRSPLPEVNGLPTVIVPKPTESSPSKSDEGSVIRRRAHPKMPEGSSVAFMRDSRIDVVTGSPKTLVNFIVRSELEELDSQDPANTLEFPLAVSSKVAPSPFATKQELQVENFETPADIVAPLTKGNSNSSMPENVDPKDATAERGAFTSSASGTWSISPLNVPQKESLSRAPDPEHLKAVWSQSSTKADLNVVNSLEAIADDIATLPFVLPEGKPSEGVTPPLPSAPSRMSLRDVTKAFQQVPTSSSTQIQSSTREKVPISPPTTNAPVARPTPTLPSYLYSPAPQNNLRPAYGPYPSPMMTQSPAPAMYPHAIAATPVPGRMPVNGQRPMYNPSMWIPSHPQPSGNLMRPVGPPYPQMMAYATPGYGPPPQPHPSMIPPTPPTQSAGRGRGVPVISPVMSPAHTHPYVATPILMHTPPQNHGYMAMPTNTGQPRPDNGHAHPRPHAVQNHTGFNPSPASPYARPW